MTDQSAAVRRPVRGAVDVLLSDGRVATVRPLMSSDRDALFDLHDHVSEDSYRFRFFTAGRAAGHNYVEHLMTAESSHEDDRPIVLLLLVADELIGVATAEPTEPATAEISFLVADSAHGFGAGTLLLEHLAAHARDRGIRRFTADVLPENVQMLRVLADTGFAAERQREPGTVMMTLDTAATAEAVASADRRERLSEAHSLAPLLRPRSVAVVGVRRDGSGVGRAVLDGIRNDGFTGRLVVVHPTADEVDGVPAYPDLGSLDAPVDLVVIAVPAPEVLAVIQQAADAGVRAAVVLSGGFSEMGAEGRAMQHQMLAVARRHSLRLIGPNCLGVMANQSGVSLNATFTRGLPPRGGLAVASQSGGVAISLLDRARESGLGISSFVSLGNKADVSGNDLLSAWLEDDEVTAAALYLESFGNAQKFARVARSFAERKPLLAVVGGRSSGGRRAGASHTAAAAAPSVGIDALFAQSGVIACRGLDDMAATALLLTTQPVPRGPRVGIVGNAGGLGVLAADAASGAGIVVPELSGEGQRQMQAYLSGTVGASNPVDLGAGVGREEFLAAVSGMLASEQVDSVLVTITATAVTDAEAVIDGLTEARAVAPDKPLLLVAIGVSEVPRPDEAGKAPFAAFRSVDEAIQSLAHAARYAAWLAAPASDLPAEDPVVAEQARALALAQVPDGVEDVDAGWLAPADVRSLLGLYGIDAPVGRVATSHQECVALAEEVGFPVALKVADPTVVHKTDRGLVRIGLRDRAAVEGCLADFAAEMGRTDVPVLVQPMVVGGVELALGVVRDPGFGPLVMVASGGVAVDVWADRVFSMPPLSESDAERSLRALRIWPLLAGHRGSQPTDVAAVQRLVVALGRLSLDVPEIAEIDLNPVMVLTDGAVCVDAKVRLATPATLLDAGIPRRLRPPAGAGD
ncbi:bifunctional acetate--CoA ligase family protein/GNAT family N-acetyltransferase [Nocardioides pacificus]